MRLNLENSRNDIHISYTRQHLLHTVLWALRAAGWLFERNTSSLKRPYICYTMEKCILYNVLVVALYSFCKTVAHLPCQHVDTLLSSNCLYNLWEHYRLSKTMLYTFIVHCICVYHSFILSFVHSFVCDILVMFFAITFLLFSGFSLELLIHIFLWMLAGLLCEFYVFNILAV